MRRNGLLYCRRTSAGSEVGFIVERNGRLIPIEAKLSTTPRPAMADPIRAFRQEVGKKAASGPAVHPGAGRLPLGY